MTEENKKDISGAIKKFAKIILGLIVVLGGLFLIWLWLPEVYQVFKGVIGIFVALIGIIIIALGWSD